MPIGIDESAGRHGEVSIEICRACGTKWLRYFVEYESYSKSGRWYRGQLAAQDLESICPENAVEFLQALPWHFAGGSYFDSTGMRRTGDIYLGP